MSNPLEISLLGLCSAVKARSLTCGYEPNQLPLDLRRLYFLSEQALTAKLPPTWLLKAIRIQLSQLTNINDEYYHQGIVEDALRRYRQGVGISLPNLTALQNEYIETENMLNEELPKGLINKSGEINQELLHKHLPQNLKVSWPKDVDGGYQLNTTTLLELDAPLASLILDAKRNHKMNIVNYLSVDKDERHRSWANPFGTKTGRERPKGGSFVFWPKSVQSIINPSRGNVIVKIDFDQQEPAIIAALSNSKLLLNAYQCGDLYEYIYNNGSWSNLKRKQFKTLTIAYLYGIQNSAIASKWRVSLNTAQQWREKLDLIFSNAQRWMNASARNAYSQKLIKSLDWQMYLTNTTKPLTVKNWPIQASGADILRRCCLKLAHHGINVIGCLHDAIMIEIPISTQQQVTELAKKLMSAASADVLSGLELKTTVERVFKTDIILNP